MVFVQDGGWENGGRGSDGVEKRIRGGGLTNGSVCEFVCVVFRQRRLDSAEEFCCRWKSRFGEGGEVD